MSHDLADAIRELERWHEEHDRVLAYIGDREIAVRRADTPSLGYYSPLYELALHHPPAAVRLLEREDV